MTGHAMVIGEALVDLLESGSSEPGSDGIVYHPAIGGAPLNVAVGIARLGARSEFAGSVGDDPWAGRMLDFLRASGVGTRGVEIVPGVATTLAVTTFRGIEPTFRFYGDPPSYGLLDDVDDALVAAAGLLYCGSMCLLSPRVLAAARKAWSIPGPVRVFDPNVRPVVGVDPDVVAEFAATADLVKLSSADATALWGGPPRQAAELAAERLLALGAGAVVVTTGAQGALVAHAAGTVRVPAPTVAAVDATGAGDATMAGLSWGILTHGLPTDLAGWERLTRVAVHVAGLVCESRGGAVSMPTLAALRTRFPDLQI